MKASKRSTYTGDWLDFEDFIKDDFDIKVGDIEFKSFGKAYQSKVVISLKSEVVDALKKAWDDDSEYDNPLWDALSRSDLMAMNREGKEIVPIVIYLSDTVRLQNVRKVETKNVRLQESKDRLSNLMGNVLDRMIDKKIAEANKAINWNIEKRINSETMKRAEGTLKWFNAWADEADEKANNTDLLDEIQELKSKLSNKQLELRQKRNSKFAEMFEAEGWKCSDEKTPLPEPIVKKWKEMLKNNEGFREGGRHDIFN